MGFSGWPVEAIEFFEGLEADNSKAYWTANKDIYERCVKAPMTELLAELAPDFGEGRIFRPYRDVRFSKDKTPYKTTIAASLPSGGYVRLSAEVLGCGAGIYMMASDQIERFRSAVADDKTGGELERIIAALERRDISVSSHEVLKSAPRGYPKDHPRIELLRNKDLVAWADWPVGEWLGTTEARRRVVGFLKDARPMNDWLATHVGDSQIEGVRPHR